MQTLASWHQNKYRRLLTQLAEELRCPQDPEKARRVLLAVLQTLRANLSFTVSVLLFHLLPHTLKYVFVENWNFLDHKPTAASRDEFISQVRQSASPITFYDFPTEADTEKTIRIVFSYLGKYMPERRKINVMRTIPAALRCFFNACS